MSKLEFISELEGLLQDISPEEREAAIKYYEDYFEDAGPENEQQIVGELETPSRIAVIIKRDLLENREEDQEGSFTENGYVGPGEEREKYLVSPLEKEGNKNESNEEKQEKSNHNETNRNQSKIILIILLCIFGIPVGLPLLFSVLGVAVGIVASIFGVFIAFAVSAIALIVSGVILLAIGFAQLFTSPPVGFVLIGGGLILFGIGAMFGIFGVWLCSKVLPSFITWVVNLCKKPFQKNKEVKR